MNKKAKDQVRRIRKYYRFQSRIYDFSRWAFLFGRKEIVNRLEINPQDEFTLWEIGCGTGENLKNILLRYPKVKVIGIDVSEDMLQIARKKLDSFQGRYQLINAPYESSFRTVDLLSPEIILFSYSLSMINPHWESLIQKAYEDLDKNGRVAVVDFHHSDRIFFKRHMANHHVKMEKQIQKSLDKYFLKNHIKIGKAYAGVWEYIEYIGIKKGVL